jgi:hypothetical protein
MTTWYFVLYLLALVCFALAAVQVHTSKVNLLGLGLAFFVAVPFLQTLQRL